MRTLLTNLTRFMPLMFLIVVLISLFQFFSQHPLTWHGMAQALGTVGGVLAAGWFYFAALAVLLWLLVIVGVRHDRKRETNLGYRRRRWRMDILDRLTNRRVLEDRMREEAE